MKRIWGIISGVLFGLLSAGIILLVSRPPQGAAILLEPPPTPAPWVIHVTGAVVEPGVYHVPPHSRVKDAIQKAGGMTEKAIQARINLAAPLEDGHQVVVPEEGQELAVQTASEATDGGETAQTGLNEPLNLNTASQQELETLPGVGPVTAEKIIAYREEQDFSRIEEIQKVSGIGPATFEKLKDLITVESTP